MPTRSANDAFPHPPPLVCRFGKHLHATSRNLVMIPVGPSGHESCKPGMVAALSVVHEGLADLCVCTLKDAKWPCGAGTLCEKDTCSEERKNSSHEWPETPNDFEFTGRRRRSGAMKG